MAIQNLFLLWSHFQNERGLTCAEAWSNPHIRSVCESLGITNSQRLGQRLAVLKGLPTEVGTFTKGKLVDGCLRWLVLPPTEGAWTVDPNTARLHRDRCPACGQLKRANRD